MTDSQTRLLLLLPCDPQAMRGNATTARRLAEELQHRGYELSLAEADSALAAATDESPADLLVALHASQAGPIAQALAERWKIPYVLLFTGTDLNGKPSGEALEAVAKARATVAMGKAAGRRARDLYPGCRDTLVLIPQGVAPLPYRPGQSLPPDAPAHDAATPIVLVPAGVRAIKDPLRAVHALLPLQQELPTLQLWFLGPEIEESTADALREACKEHPWIHWLPARPREELLPFYRRANVVLSTSRSEGGAPNSLLEAALVGRPVLASSIPPHREFPGADHCFRDDRELRKCLRDILEQPDQAMLRARKLQEIVRQPHSPAAESLAWDRLLRGITG